MHLQLTPNASTFSSAAPVAEAGREAILPMVIIETCPVLPVRDKGNLKSGMAMRAGNAIGELLEWLCLLI